MTTKVKRPVTRVPSPKHHGMRSGTPTKAPTSSRRKASPSRQVSVKSKVVSHVPEKVVLEEVTPESDTAAAAPTNRSADASTAVGVSVQEQHNGEDAVEDGEVIVERAQRTILEELAERKRRDVGMSVCSAATGIEHWEVRKEFKSRLGEQLRIKFHGKDLAKVRKVIAFHRASPRSIFNIHTFCRSSRHGGPLDSERWGPSTSRNRFVTSASHICKMATNMISTHCSNLCAAIAVTATSKSRTSPRSL